MNLSRRHLLRIAAASAGVPFIALAPPHPALVEQPAEFNPQAAPTSGTTDLPGEDLPEARARTVHNLMLMGLAMQNFALANHGRFPAAAIRKDGKPLLSWRVALLPFLDVYRGVRLYQKFRLDEPWDSPHNAPLLKEMPSVFAPVASTAPAPYSTYYQVFVGPGALFDQEEGTRIAQVTDGVAWTLMVVEAAEPVPWTKPQDLPHDHGEPLPRLGGQFEDGFYVAFADGSARFLSRKIARETLSALIMRGDGELITVDELGPW
jgi:hypothetical protein